MKSRKAKIAGKKPGYDLTLIIPAYDEEATIERAICESISVFRREGMRLELIVIDDGSSDRTSAICAGLRKKKSFIFIRHRTNRGYSSSLKEGIMRASGFCVSYLDADMQYPPAEILKLYRSLEQGNVDFVLGSAKSKGYGIVRKVITRIYNLLVKALFRISFDDVHCKRVFKRKLIKPHQLSGYFGLIDLELLLLAVRNGARIRQVPITVMPRRAGKSKLTAKLMMKTLFNLIRLRLRRSR
ncbi:MAG: glycosyltransferase family 2 protein [archaeon]